VLLNAIHKGDALSVLKYWPSESIDCCITSPPYFNLRNYQVEGQIGTETHIDWYINKIMDVCYEIHRLLKPTGSLWLVLGDTYNGNKKGNTNRAQKKDMPKSFQKRVDDIIPVKSMCMIPERIAIILTEYGWCLRNKIIWYKPNAMPNSAPDRFGNDYENVYFFTKQSRGYYYEQQYEPFRSEGWGKNIKFGGNRASSYGNPKYSGNVWNPKDAKVKRSVWEINTKPYSGAHFAVFPEELVERMMRAGCPEGGVCLDPFMGSGTVAVVAKRMNRNYLGVELNEEYIKLAQARLQNNHKNTYCNHGGVSIDNGPLTHDLLLDAYI
jgi:DNA modification methylase